MATLLDNPLLPPHFDLQTWRQDDERYISKCRDLCRANGDHPLLGQVVRWQRADGYAEYMVFNIEPLELIHLPLGDAYEVEAPLIRGLERQDIEEMIEREDRIRKIFANNRA